MKDYYGILGVDKNASPDEIKKAYRKLSKQFHPDVNPEGAERFKEIAEAYDTLGNSDKKQKYDNPMTNMFGGGGPGGMGFEDFLSQMGFNRNPFNGQQRRPNAPEKIINIDVTPIESFLGVQKDINYRREVGCSPCNGTGGERATCTNCHGSGQVVQQVGGGAFQQIFRQACPLCQGKGTMLLKACYSCNGKSTTGEFKNLKINLTHGIDDGEYYRVDGGGDYHNGAYGNLLLKVNMVRDEHWEKLGNDLIYHNIVDLTGLESDSVEIPHPDGKISIKYPETFDTSTPMRVKNKGFKREMIGDMYIKNTVRFKREKKEI
jgi:molecular chaperone DnaJ